MPEISKPRIGLLGTGWIGRLRLQALLASEAAEVIAVCDPDAACLAEARALVPTASACEDLDKLLRTPGLQGVVIATPSALHAEQSRRCLAAGVAVYCQKPLGRDGAETIQVIQAAAQADRLLGVDLCYRHLQATQAVRQLIDAGELGEIYAARLVFHNAYGPDKPWFYQRSQAGGGCLIDLGIHLVDLALWLLRSDVVDVTGRCFAQGKPLALPSETVEDYVTARLDLASGAAVDIACSWRLPAGQDAVIELEFFGTQGGAAIKNVQGSFFDFTAHHYPGTARQLLAEPPDDWGGRALLAWVHRLAIDNRFDPAVRHVAAVAGVLDRIYGLTDASEQRAQPLCGHDVPTMTA